MPRINSAAELEDVRKGILAKRDPQKPCVAICAGMGCVGLGHEGVVQAFEDEVKKKKLKAKVDIRVTG